MPDTVPGLVMVFTGDGKGKTTAAFGAALRALGAGWKVHVVQFVKSPRPYGEVVAAERLIPDLTVVSAGIGFVREGKGPSPEEHRAAALEALALCREARDAQLLILDEVNFALSKGLLGTEEVLTFIEKRPAGQTVILTGRGAPEAIVQRADLVTEMVEVKHPFAKGVQARKGIEH
ncbi:MAG: cob(I)yrinic acid a,c-diamide adenosyltransferase [Planctomycetota bacterium]|jgi:cob(I)alamin adenosyltransferase